MATVNMKADNGSLLCRATMYEGNTFRWVVPGWIVRSIYRVFSSKGVGADTNWTRIDSFDYRIGAYKNYPSTSMQNVFGDYKEEKKKFITEAFGYSLEDCIIIARCVTEYTRKWLCADTSNDYERVMSEVAWGRIDEVNKCPCSYFEYLILPIGYIKAIPREVEGYYGGTSRTIDLKLYSPKGEEIGELISGSYSQPNSTRGKYVDERYPATAKTLKTINYTLLNDIPVMEDCGCIDCASSEYHIENGVYLRCTSCGKEVKEIEYDGTYYPDYCPRNIAKKIRSYNETYRKIHGNA